MTADEFEEWKEEARIDTTGYHRGVKYVLFYHRPGDGFGFIAEAPVQGLNTSLFPKREQAEEEIKRAIEFGQSRERAKLAAWNAAARGDNA